GQSASFMAGGEVPFAGPDSGTIFKEYGIQLTFEPTVIDGNLISLQINTSVSDIDDSSSVGSQAAPALKTRRASTSVEMRDGQSFAIAGLLKDDFSDNANQVPWLGDVPVLGALFRSTKFSRKQTELVVIVTPHLVVPTTGGALAMPTERMRIPTEDELFLNGTTEGSVLSGSASSKGPQGAYGYVME
ncbi:MAG TPA: hypothetical protein VLA51_09685, partial [Paracoccaceae bacterium]|nr:hypothetical protein [Paracoccaceae bacterium]